MNENEAIRDEARAHAGYYFRWVTVIVAAWYIAIPLAERRFVADDVWAGASIGVVAGGCVAVIIYTLSWWAMLSNFTPQSISAPSSENGRALRRQHEETITLAYAPQISPDLWTPLRRAVVAGALEPVSLVKLHEAGINRTNEYQHGDSSYPSAAHFVRSELKLAGWAVENGGGELWLTDDARQKLRRPTPPNGIYED